MAGQDRTAPRWLPAAPALFVVMWAAGFAVGGLGLRHAEPLTLLSLRYGLVIAVLAPVALVLRPPLPRTRAEWGHLAVVGLLLQGCYFSFVWNALELGASAGTVALVTSLQPILTTLLAPRLAGERAAGLRGWIGLALGLSGAALVIVARSAVEVPTVTGLFIATLALLAITSGTLYERRFGVAQHPVTANLVQCAVGLAVTLPLALLIEEQIVDWAPELYGALAYLVLGNSLIAVTLLLAMIRFGEASRVSTLFFLVPPVASLIAWPLLGESVPAASWPGLALAATGVALATRS
jgi:drug/metabolite transporter (DMT)-like permease